MQDKARYATEKAAYKGEPDCGGSSDARPTPADMQQAEGAVAEKASWLLRRTGPHCIALVRILGLPRALCLGAP